MTENNTACRTREAFTALRQFANDHDNEAFARFMLNPLNGCRQLSANVVVEDRAILDDLAEVREIGNPNAYWTGANQVRRGSFIAAPDTTNLRNAIKQASKPTP